MATTTTAPPPATHDFDYIVVHEQDLSECYAASLWVAFNGAKIVHLNPHIPFGPVDVYANMRILVVGNYLSAPPTETSKAVKCHVTQFANDADPSTVNEAVALPIKVDARIVCSGDTGFLTWTTQQLKSGEAAQRVASIFDRISYGYPTDDDLSFHRGIYTIDMKAGQTKLDSVKSAFGSMAAIDTTIKIGKSERAQHDDTIASRFMSSKIMHILIPGIAKRLRICVAFGDTPLGDSAYRLASTTGIGLLMNYNLADNVTQFVICCTAASKQNAGVLMSKLVKDGGGSKHIAIDTLPGLCVFSRTKPDGKVWPDSNTVVLGWLQHVE
jgi:hypothetical protein